MRDLLTTERTEDLIDDGVSVEACLLIHFLGRVLIDEDVGKDHRADFDSCVERTGGGEVMQAERTKPANRTLFDGDEHLVVLSQLM